MEMTSLQSLNSLQSEYADWKITAENDGKGQTDIWQRKH